MARLQNAGKRTGAGQQHHYSNHQGHGRNELAGYEDKAIDGRGPMRREGHRPIDCGETHGENIKNDAGPSKRLEAAPNGVVLWIRVLFTGPTIEQKRQNAPDGKVQDGADTEAVRSQIRALKLREGAFPGGRRIEPAGVQILHAKKNGHEKHRDNGQGSCGGLQRAADHNAPISAGEMLQHKQAERAQRKAQNKYEGEQVGREKALREFEEAENATHQTNHGGDKRALADAVNALWRSEILRGHSGFPPGAPSPFFSGLCSAGGCKTFSRMSGGSSETLALRLNCRARRYATTAQRSRGGICAE